jgi:HrpA-like RNA helicase
MARYCVDKYGLDKRWRIAVTNPKSATTDANARFAANIADVPLGKQVGFVYRGSPSTSFDKNTRVLYLTDGYLLAQAKSDKNLGRFAAVIIDEAHERPVPSDVCMYYCRAALVNRKDDFKLVVMSATIDPTQFVSFFERQNLRVNVIYAAGQSTHHIEPFFLTTIPADIVSKCIETVFGILETSNHGDIIVFVATSKEAESACIKFNDICKTNNKHCVEALCSTLYSRMPISAQQDSVRLVDPKKDKGKKRRVLFTTPIAESSFTFANAVFVVDSGFELRSTWDPSAHADIITKTYTSQAQITQRKGRVGRVAPGFCFHLYTKEVFDSLPKFPSPTILTIDFTDDILSFIIQLGIDDTRKMLSDLITPPSIEQIEGALAFLQFHGILDSNLNISPLGLAIYKLSISTKTSVKNTLLLYTGTLFKSLSDTSVLCAIAEETGGDFMKLWSTDRFDKINKKIASVIDSMSDHRTLVQVFNTFVKGHKRLPDVFHFDTWNKISAKLDMIQSYAKSDNTFDISPPASKIDLSATDPFIAAVLSARAYNAFNLKTGNAFPHKPTQFIKVDSDFHKVKHLNGVYDTLVNNGREFSARLITWTKYPLI